MFRGIIVGIVEDNKDPEMMHRIKVRLPMSGGVQSHWCRIASPNAGTERGLVILPDIGTEVVLMYAYRSMHPYVIGGVYNGKEDQPEPYYNDDGNNDKRVFWSRNDHMVVFDDTSGSEKVEIGAQASKRLDVSSAPIYHQLDSANKKITEYCDGISHYHGKKSITVKCKSLSVKTGTCLLDAGQSIAFVSKQIQINTGAAFRTNSPNTLVKKSGAPVTPTPAPPAPPAMHPPKA